MRRRPLLAPLAALLVALAVAGCGGSDDGDADADPKAAYLEQAEAVCADANVAIDAETLPAEVAEIPAYVDRLLAVLRSTVSEFAALEPPADDREELRERVIEPLQSDVARAEEYATQVKAAAEAGDSAALLRLVTESPQTSADLEFMRSYGFDECVEAADTGP